MAESRMDRRRGCREFQGRGVSRRDALRAGAVAMAGLGLARAVSESGGRRGAGWIRPGEVVPPDLHVGRAEPARYLGPEARCAGGDPRQLRHDRDEDPGRPDQRALADAGHADGQAGDRPVDEPRRLHAPLDGAPRPDRPPGPDAVFRRRRAVAQRLAAPGLAGRAGPPAARGAAPGGDDALDGRASGRARRQGPRPARRLARQGLRPVPRRRRPQRRRFPRRGARAARRDHGRPARRPSGLAGRGSITSPGSPGPAPPPGTATAIGRSTRSDSAEAAGAFRDRSRGPAAPRPLRPEHPRPVPACWPAA